MPGYFPASIWCLRSVALRSAGDVDKRGHPVEGREHVVLDRARLDVSRPTNDARSAHAAFPRGQLPTFKRCVAAVWISDHLGAVVRGEDEDGVIQLAHLFQLLDDDADVVIHLLHAGFVDTPVFATGFAHHRHVFMRQHGRDVHARRVVPDEEGLVRFLGVIAIEKVNDLAGDFLVNRLRAIECQRTLVLARLVRFGAVG